MSIFDQNIPFFGQKPERGLLSRDKLMSAGANSVYPFQGIGQARAGIP
jgi:hypothetical protein